MSVLTAKDEARHYRDDGPLVDALSRVLPGGDPAAAALPAGLLVLLPLAALALVPDTGAAWAVAVTTAVAAVGNARAARRKGTGLLDWLVPAVLRLGEYAALLRLTVLVAPEAVPACFALLAALGYHHYDVIYRLRDRGELPPRWLRWSGLGWEGRLLAAAALAGAGVLAEGLVVAAVVLGVGYVADGVVGWLRSERHGAAGREGSRP